MDANKIYTSAVNLNLNGSYFLGKGGLGNQKLLLDTTELICPSPKGISAVAFKKVVDNRLGIAIGWYENGVLNWECNKEHNDKYEDISREVTYMSSANVLVPEGKICKGIKFSKNAQLIKFKIYVVKPGDSFGQWIENPEQEDHLLAPVTNLFADSSAVILPPSLQPKSFYVYQKKDRFAPSFGLG